jgi:large subunit ribosomal protein L25
MEVGKLTVQRRQQTGKGVARKLRAQGKIPGVCYGHELGEPVAIAVDTRALKASLDPVKRQNTVIDMTLEDDGQGSRAMTVMVKDYQIDTIRRELTHVDLIAIDTTREVVSEVPVDFAGKAKGLVLGGQLHVVRRTIQVQCTPGAIPDKVVVDISDLDIGGVIHVSDVEMPAGVAAHTPGHITLITCTAPDAGAEEGTEAAPVAEAAKAPAAKAPAAKAKGKDEGK